MLILKDVQAGYGNIKVLKGVSLEVPDRSIVTLLGANGAGKTTTARTITGLTSATGGTIEFNGGTWQIGIPADDIKEDAFAGAAGSAETHFLAGRNCQLVVRRPNQD